MVKYIPNILTIVRFLLIPSIISYAIDDNYVAVIIVVLISAATDVLDGTIARKFNFITDFGKLIDPLADKCTLISILIVLAYKTIIPLWIIITLITKELLCIIVATFILCEKNLITSSKWFGKLATVLFYLAILSSMLIRHFDLNYNFDLFLYYAGLGFAIFASLMYGRMYITNKFTPRNTN